MPQFRKKPVTVEAVRFDGFDGDEIRLSDQAPSWLGDALRKEEGDTGGAWRSAENGGLNLGTTEGHMHASPGDWIIRGTQGEIYPCKPDIFAEIYEAA